MTDDPLVSVDVHKLEILVAKTPFKMHEFERLIGWSFSMGDAPQSKRALAWAILQLPQDHLEILYEAQRHHPKLWVSEVSIWNGSSGAV